MKDFLGKYILKKIYSKILYGVVHRSLGYFIYLTQPIRFKNHYFYFPKCPFIYYSAYYTSDRYEINEINMAEEFIDREDVVLELGGCIGVVACKINSILENPEDHVVLEPNPNMLPFLEKNRVLNESKFSIEPHIISDIPEMDFNICNNDFLASSTFKVEETINQTIKVSSTSISKLEKKYGLSFNVLVMDIEGAELSFLRDNDLSQFRLLIIEFHESIIGKNGCEECYEILRKNAFKQIDVKGNVQCWTK